MSLFWIIDKSKALLGERQKSIARGLLCGIGNQGLLKAEGEAGTEKKSLVLQAPYISTGNSNESLEEFEAWCALTIMIATTKHKAQILTRFINFT